MDSSSNQQGAISQCLLGYSFHTACFSSSLSRHGPLHPSRCSQQILTMVCIAPPTSARFNSCALFGTSCSGVWDPRSVESILQTCSVVVVQKHRLALFRHLHGFRCRHLLDIEISILNAFLHPSIVYQCVLFVVLLPTDPSNNLLSSSPFVSQPSLEFPDPCIWISSIVQFDLLSPLRRTPLLQRSGLSSSEEWIQILQCDCQSGATNPVVLFLETSVFGNSNAALGFQPDIALHVSAE